MQYHDMLVQDAPALPLGHKTVTVTGTAATLAELLTAASAGSVPSSARVVWLMPEADGIVYTEDGSAPTLGAGGNGEMIDGGGKYPVRMLPDALAAMKFIAAVNTKLRLKFRG